MSNTVENMKNQKSNINTDPLSVADKEIFNLIQEETHRQEYGLEMIPSENFVSEAVLEACGSILTNKYAEGLPNRRYYGGCEVVDRVEDLTRQRCKDLFKAQACNVQPHSGATANEAVYSAFLEPGDTVLGMRLDMGGHLTHGSPVNFSGKLYNIVAYGVDKETHIIDMNEVRDLALKHKPKMIIAGASAYSRIIDFKAFREIADEVGALFMADIAHYAGLIAAGCYPTPVGFAHIVTTTTHKTLRGPRSGLIMSDLEYIKKINKSVFPGLQGGPHIHTIAAKAVAFKEAMTPEFKQYSKQVILNAQKLASCLQNEGLEIVSGGTDSHVFLVDLRPFGINGKIAQATLDGIHFTCNKNTIPYDPESPMIGSGIRLGTPALTTRGMKEGEMEIISKIISTALKNHDNESELEKLKKEIYELSSLFPMYKHRLVK